MNLEAERARRLAALYRSMNETDRAVRRDARRGHGPALDAWKVGRTQAETALDVLLPTEDEQ